jgi:hypothetical protein
VIFGMERYPADMTDFMEMFPMGGRMLGVFEHRAVA